MCIYVITLRSCSRFTSWLGMSLIRIPRNCFICDIEGASCAECQDSNQKQSGKSRRAQDFRIGWFMIHDWKSKECIVHSLYGWINYVDLTTRSWNNKEIDDYITVSCPLAKLKTKKIGEFNPITSQNSDLFTPDMVMKNHRVQEVNHWKIRGNLWIPKWGYSDHKSGSFGGFP